jgi:hypothetical protein
MPSGPKITARIDGDGRGWQQTLKTGERQAVDFATHVRGTVQGALGGNLLGSIFARGFATVGIGAVGAMVDQMVERFNDKLKDIKIGTQRTGLDSEQFQQFQNLTKSTEVSTDAVAVAMDHVAAKQQEIIEGGDQASKVMKDFGLLGVSAADAQTKSFQELFVQMFRYMQTVEMTGERLTALREIMGRAGPELIPAAKMGLESKTANKGLLDDKEIKDMQAFNRQVSEGPNFDDSANFWGKIGTLVKGSIKSIPRVFDPESYKSESTEEYYKRKEDDEKRKMLAEKDAKREAARMQKDQVDFQEKLANQKAEKDLPRLQENLDKKQEAARLKAMAPEARLQDLLKQLDNSKFTEFLAKDVYDQTGEPVDKKALLETGLDRQSLEDQVATLQEQIKSGNKFGPVAGDALAQIGGFTGASGVQKDSGPEIKNKIQEILGHLNRGILLKYD